MLCCLNDSRDIRVKMTGQKLETSTFFRTMCSPSPTAPSNKMSHLGTQILRETSCISICLIYGSVGLYFTLLFTSIFPADMVKNKGFLPSDPSEIPTQRNQIKDIVFSLLPACKEPDLDTGIPFQAEAIIANPPAYG